MNKRAKQIQQLQENLRLQKLEGDVADLETLIQQVIMVADNLYNHAHGII